MNFYLEHKRINDLLNFYNKTNNKLMELDGSIQIITNINNQLLKSDIDQKDQIDQIDQIDQKDQIDQTYQKDQIDQIDQIYQKDQIDELKNKYIIMKKNYQDSLDKLATEVVEKDLIIQKLNDEIDNMTKLLVLNK